jgi:hypothetical protein
MLFRAHQHVDIDVHQHSLSLAKSIHTISKYPLNSSSVLYPEQFPHPKGSIDAKRSVLISLSPMLTQAEEQRKKDTKDCEEFTRCRSTKGKGRSSYEYIDLDTTFKVDFEEFERR